MSSMRCFAWSKESTIVKRPGTYQIEKSGKYQKDLASSFNYGCSDERMLCKSHNVM